MKLSLCFHYGIIGLANKKTVTIQSAGKDQSVLLATTKPRKQNKPAALLHKSVMKKEFRRMAKAVQNQVIFIETISKCSLCGISGWKIQLSWLFSCFTILI